MSKKYFISFIVKLSSKSVLSFRERSFTNNMNNKGELVSPCFRPIYD